MFKSHFSFLNIKYKCEISLEVKIQNVFGAPAYMYYKLCYK